ncbi:MAG: Ig-like domain-containing protein, partial [Humibacter sp.]
MRARKSRRLFAGGKRRIVASAAIVVIALGAPLFSEASGAFASPVSTVHSETGPEDGHYCDECQPPLEYNGGPTMDTQSTDGVVITPIFWAPPAADPFPDGYVDGLDRYVNDVAAASGQPDNVYSVTTEYYMKSHGASTPLQYRISATDPITDTAAFPDNGCTPDDDTTPICITDDQLRAELSRVIQENGLPTGLGHFYPVFLPPGVEAQDRDKTTSGSSFCGYHRMFGDAPNQVVYGNEPFEASNCDGGQAPNGSLALDGAISTLSHELSESLTDPDSDSSAWLDHTSHEIGDICADDYGTALGSVDPAHPFTTEYNQVINGDKYYTQTEFSNSSFSHYGVGFGCAQSEQQATTDPSKAPKDIAEVFSDITPNTTSKGDEKAKLQATVYDRAGDPVSGDAVTFTAYVVSGDGSCGDFSQSSATTDDQGGVTTTYTGTKDAVTCALVAHEARGGHSGTSRIYQGKAADTAPQASATFPDTLETGGDARTFTTTFTNGTHDSIPSSQIEFDIYPADKATVAVDHSDLHLSYS